MNQIEEKDKGADISGCLRKLTNFERYLLWSPENNFATVARIVGDVQEERLRRAIDSVGAAHPLISARVIIDEHRDIWFSTYHAQKPTLRTVPRTSEEQWFVLAAFQEIRGGLTENRRTIQVPFDLRSRLGVKPGDFLGFFAGAFKFPFDYDFKRSFWENAKEMQEIMRKKAEMLDTSAIDMESFDPTLVDAFTNCAPYADLLPEAFSQTDNLSSFARDRGNIAFELSSQAIYNLPGTISSNIGRMQFSDGYGSLKLDRMFFVAPASEAFPIFIAGISINDRLAFSLNYIVRVGEEDVLTGDMIKIRNRALEHLGFPGKINDRAM